MALAIVTNVASAQDEVAMFCGVSVPWCEALARGFRTDTGIVVNITFKDSADALAHVAAEKDDPKHDVWYSGNGDSQLRAAETGLVDEYRSALLPLLHDWALRQAEQARGRAIGVHAAVVGIGYNSKALANKRLPEPRCWADLAQARVSRRAALRESVGVAGRLPDARDARAGVRRGARVRADEGDPSQRQQLRDHGERCDTCRRAWRDDDRRRDAA